MKIDDFLVCVKCGGKMDGLKCTACGNDMIKLHDNIYSTLKDNDNNLQEPAVIDRRVNILKENKFSDLMIDIVAKEFRDEKGLFLDIGCGSGYYSDAIANRLNNNISFVGIDIGNSFDFRKASDKYTFIRADIFRHPFKSGSFDGIVGFDVIEHLEDDGKFLEIVLDLLKKGGKFFLGTPNGNRLPSLFASIFKGKKKFPFDYGRDPVLGDMIHMREYTLPELEKLLGRFSDRMTYEIKPTLLGSRIAKSAVGIKNHGEFLKAYTYAWMIFGQKK
jgi:SAM-dependent methyltransferase